MATALMLSLAEGDALSLANIRDASRRADQVTPAPSQYRGLWAPALVMDQAQSMDDPTHLRMAGFNTVSVVAPVLVDAFGSVSAPFPMAALSRKIGALRENRLDTLLAVELIYAPDGTLRTAQFGSPLPPSLVRDQADQLLAAYRFLTWRYAQLAEAEQVAMFAPINEADLRLGAETARQWSQPLLQTARRVYHGPLVWKADRDLDLDLRGYTAIGITLFPSCDTNLEAFAAQVGSRLDHLARTAEANEVPLTLVAEFGNASSCFGGRTAYDTSRVADVVFKEGRRRGITGYFAFDPPYLTHQTPLRGTAQEATISRWYLTEL